MDQDDASLLPVGARVDQYEIIGLLGRGGFGITYKVYDPALRRDFALKEFFPSGLVVRDGRDIRVTPKSNGDSDYQWAKRKFYGEARLLAQFNHRNIVSVQRIFEANNSAYIVLDFIEGGTLEAWLRSLRSPPTQEELDLIAGPLLGALELVHDNRSWHLDVSPENIMIRAADGAPILLDFGASRFEIKQHSQLVSAMVFKSGYSAPEQYTSNADRYGPWTDIYATGATLYRAIAGERPTEATSRTIADDLVPAAKLGKGRYRDNFLRAIDWAMQISPAARPQTARAWRAALLGTAPSPSPASRAAPAVAAAAAGDALRGMSDRLDSLAVRVQRKADGMARQYRANPRRALTLSAVPAALLVLLGVNLALDPFGPDRATTLPTPVINASAESMVPPQGLPPQMPPMIDLPTRPRTPGRLVTLPLKLGSLLSDGRKGWLGVNLVPVEADMAKALGLPDTKGAIVREMATDGPAARAGMRSGDIVVGLDGSKVEDVNDVRRRVQARPPETEISLEIWRPGTESRDFTQTLLGLAGEGNSHVMSWLGHVYALGLGVTRDDGEAVRWFRQGANGADSASMLGLANMMIAGRGTERDQAAARGYLSAAGRAGNLDAYERLATLHIETRRRNSDAAPAAQMYASLAENGHTLAMVRLGSIYQLGLGVRKNPQQAVSWIKKAADLGDPAGIADLGAVYYQGYGVEKNQQEAVVLFKRAAELGNLTALHNLAAVYESGAGGEARDPEKAADLIMYTLGAGSILSYRHMTETARTWSKEFKGALQRRLQEANYYSGPIDGEFKQPTIAAMKALFERQPRAPCNA